MYRIAPLFGKIHAALKPAFQRLRAQPLHHLESLLPGRLKAAHLQPNPTQENSRQRLFTPKLTFLAFLDQILNASSCRQALRQIRAFYQQYPAPPTLDDNTSGYCQARARWSVSELVACRRDLAAGSSRPLDPPLPTHGREFKVVDGTCLTLEDTAANRQAYGYPPRTRTLCGFPVLRAVGLFSLSSGAWLELASGAYRTSENALFKQLWSTLGPGDILLGDRNFSAWAVLASLRQRGADGLFRSHASRNADFRQGRRLGHNERLVTWTKPQRRGRNFTPEEWAALPATLTVRLLRFKIASAACRCQHIIVVTTLLDRQLWPLELLARWYARRWKIELYLKDIKTTLGMDQLRCRSPKMIAKELQMYALAYNLTRSLMAEAAAAAAVPLDRLSFKGSLDTAREYSRVIACIPQSNRRWRQRIYADMLAAIAGDPVPERPNRYEPRHKKHRPKAFPKLRRPRAVLKQEFLERSRPRKTT
jgi:hypothetical protein